MTTPHTSYLICSTPRTGSSLLCDALTGTGVAGRPEEYFQFRARTGFPRRPQEDFEGAGAPEIFDILGPRTRVGDVEARYDPSRYERYEQYLDWAVQEGTTPNGVFGAKVMWGYFNGLVTGLRWALPGGRQRLPVPDLVQSVFPNVTYITMSRRDKVRQAVSLWRAVQTWSWSSDQSPAGDRLTYSHAAIAHLIREIEDHELGWRSFFREGGFEPFDVVYEDFAGRYKDTIRAILRHLALPEAGTIAIEQPTRRKQADDLSRRWADRYQVESGRFATA